MSEFVRHLPPIYELLHVTAREGYTELKSPLIDYCAHLRSLTETTGNEFVALILPDGRTYEQEGNPFSTPHPISFALMKQLREKLNLAIHLHTHPSTDSDDAPLLRRFTRSVVMENAFVSNPLSWPVLKLSDQQLVTYFRITGSVFSDLDVSTFQEQPYRVSLLLTPDKTHCLVKPGGSFREPSADAFEAYWHAIAVIHTALVDQLLGGEILSSADADAMEILNRLQSATAAVAGSGGWTYWISDDPDSPILHRWQ